MRVLALLGALLLIGAAPNAMQSRSSARPVPTSLPGATVVHTAAAKALLQKPGLVIVDVSEKPRRPQGLAPGAPWLPPGHRDIPGSFWIPGAGHSPISPALEHYFRTRLTELTGGARDRPILIYCHPHCWSSWNAARRVVGYGYRDVFWYPDGIEGWEDAGLPTAPANQQGPGARPKAGKLAQSPAR